MIESSGNKNVDWKGIKLIMPRFYLINKIVVQTVHEETNLVITFSQLEQITLEDILYGRVVLALLSLLKARQNTQMRQLCIFSYFLCGDICIFNLIHDTFCGCIYFCRQQTETKRKIGKFLPGLILPIVLEGWGAGYTSRTTFALVKKLGIAVERCNTIYSK